MTMLSRTIAGLGFALLSATGSALAQGYPAKPIATALARVQAAFEGLGHTPLRELLDAAVVRHVV